MNEMQAYLAEEFAEDYEAGRITRRDALKLIASVTGSLIAANTILAACAPPPAVVATSPPATESVTHTDTPSSEAGPISGLAAAGTVAPDDPAIQAGPVEIPAGDATLFGYLGRPVEAGAYPVVLVCHENRGLTPHIQDVTRRFAKAGYAALAIDLVSRLGGTEVIGTDNAPGALGGIPTGQTVGDFVSGWQYLQEQEFADAARVGMVGFCFGGGITWRVAAGMPELRAAVPFYGPPALESDIPNIQAAVLAIYGELDTRISQTIPATEAAMLANNKIYEKLVYPGADHAFFNDTSSRYNPEAATDAWARTLSWFAQYL